MTANIQDESSESIGFTQSTPIAIVGVHLARERILGTKTYDFKRISRQKGAFKALAAKIQADYGVTFETQASSTGREPCVLAKFQDGSTSMLLDARDLATINGSMENFEKTLRAKLFLFF